MTKLLIRPVTNSREKRRFLHYPWDQYRGDPYWVPPLRQNQKELVGYARHPFYEDAKVQTFLAWRDGVPVGRIAAILHHAHNRRYKDDPRGFVGFFESIDDQSVADGLFAAARDWFANHGIHAMRGPLNPSMNYECGLLVDGFEMSPTFMMTYNPNYYPALWENFGFEKSQDLFTFTGFKSNLEQMEAKVAFVAVHAMERFGIVIRSLDKKHFMRDVRSFLNIYNASLEGNWGHVPMSPAEVEHTANSLRFLLVPQLTIIAEIEGKPVGAMLGLLDYNGRIRSMNGRLFPFGFLKLLTGRREIRRIRLMSTNVLPAYQRWGVGVVLASNMLEPALAFGMEEGEFSWVLESNHLSRKTLERGNVGLEKIHRIYDYGP